jgi:hypothetical protein
MEYSLEKWKRDPAIKARYPNDTSAQEVKIMRALVAAGDKGLTRTQLGRLVREFWKMERALNRLLMFEKARCERRRPGPRRSRTHEKWFALVADDTMEHGLNPDWVIVVDGA